MNNGSADAVVLGPSQSSGPDADLELDHQEMSSPTVVQEVPERHAPWQYFEKPRTSRLRERLFATQKPGECWVTDATQHQDKATVMNAWQQEEEIESLASSLQLSITAGQEQSRNSSTLLHTLKVSEEARIEERSRALQLRNRLLNTEARTLVLEQACKQQEAQLQEKERAVQEAEHQSHVAKQDRIVLESEQARLKTELMQAKSDRDHAKHQIASLELLAESHASAKATREQQFEEARERASRAEGDASTHRAAADSKAAECEALKAELGTMHAKLEEMEERVSKTSAGWAASSAQCDVLQLGNARLEASKLRLQSELSEARAQVEANMWEARANDSALREAKQAWNEVEENLRGQVKQQQQLLADGKMREDESRDYQSKIESKMSNVLQELEVSRTETRAYEEECEGVRVQLRHQAMEKEGLRARVAELEVERTRLLRRRQEVCTSLLSMLNEVTGLGAALSDHRESLRMQSTQEARRAEEAKRALALDEEQQKQTKQLILQLEDAQHAAEEERDRYKAMLKQSEDKVRQLEDKYMSAEELLHRTEHDHEESQRLWRSQLQEQREKLVKRSQTFLKRWSVRSHFALWKQAVIVIHEERQELAFQALEQAALKSEERARALEQKYALTEAELQRTTALHQEEAQTWDQQQQEHYESLIKRSKLFAQRWTMRSLLSIWREKTSAAREERLRQTADTDKEGLLATWNNEKQMLLEQQKQLEQAFDAERSGLTKDLQNTRSEVQQLAAVQNDLESRLANALRELTAMSEKAAVMGKQGDGLRARMSDISKLLEASQSEGRRLQAMVNRLEQESDNHKIRATEAEEKIIALQSSHATLSAQLSAKKSECSEQTVHLAELRAEKDVASATIKDLEERMSLAREDGEERELVISELQSQTLPALRGELFDKGLSIKDLTGQLATARDMLEHSEKEAAAREESNAKAWTTVKEVRARLLSHDATVQQLNSDLSESKSNIENLEQTDRALRETIQGLKNTIVQLQNAQLTADETRADLEVRKNEEAKRVAALREENAILQKDKEDLNTICQQQRTEIRELKQHLAEFEERAKDLESVVHREQVELSRQRAARKESEKLNSEIISKQLEAEKAYKARETAAVKALSTQLQKLKDDARLQLDEVSKSCGEKLEEAAEREREVRSMLSQLQAELRGLLQERSRLELRTSEAESELERVSSKATSQLNETQTKLKQMQSELNEKTSELEKTTTDSARLQGELANEQRLMQAARMHGESVARELQVANSQLAEDQQRVRALQNQVLDCERRISALSGELEVQLQGAKEESHALLVCRKELQTARSSLQDTESSLKDALFTKKATQKELERLRSAYDELIPTSEEAKILKRKLDTKDKAHKELKDDLMLLEQELESMKTITAGRDQELSALRLENQRVRANEASIETARTRDESKIESLEKKVDDMKRLLENKDEKLLCAQRELQEVALLYEKARAMEENVEALGRMLRLHLSKRVCGERQVRMAVGLPPRVSFIQTSIGLKQRKTPASGVKSLVFGYDSDEENGQGPIMNEELRTFVLKRVIRGWREQSNRIGSGLVHALCVWGWRRALEAALEFAEVVNPLLSQASGTESGKGAGNNASISERMLANGNLSAGSMLTILHAKRALVHARGMMKDFSAHTPVDAFSGSSIMISEAKSNTRILGCTFVDWHSRVLKMRKARFMMMGSMDVLLRRTRDGMDRTVGMKALMAWRRGTTQFISERRAAEVAYPEICEKLYKAQSAFENSSQHEAVTQLELRQTQENLDETKKKLNASETLVSALKQELTKFYKLPSPCGIGMEMEADMRGQVRVGTLEPQMSAQMSGAISEGDIVLSINDLKISSKNLDTAKATLVGKRASLVAILLKRGNQTFTVNLKRGSWGPEHASVSTEQESSSAWKTSEVRAEDKNSQPKPSELEAPSKEHPTQPQLDSSLDASGADNARQVVVQGNYAAARRSQGPGPLAPSPEV